MADRYMQAGFPLPDETAPTKLPGMGSQTSHPSGENPLYVSASHEVQFRTAAAIAGMHNTSPTKIHSSSKEQGYIPRYAGHRANAHNKGVGGSIYGFQHKDKKKLDYSYMTQGNDNDDFGGIEYLDPDVELAGKGSLTFGRLGTASLGSGERTVKVDCKSYDQTLHEGRGGETNAPTL